MRPWILNVLLAALSLSVVAGIMFVAMQAKERQQEALADEPWLIDDSIQPCESCGQSLSWKAAAILGTIVVGVGSGPSIALLWKKSVPIYKSNKRFRLTVIWSIRGSVALTIAAFGLWVLSTGSLFLGGAVFATLGFWGLGLYRDYGKKTT